MSRVVHLETLADIGGSADAGRISVSARHEAVLEDGRRLLPLGDRGWSETIRGAGAHKVSDIWAVTTEQEIAETARAVVGPDEPFGGARRTTWKPIIGTRLPTRSARTVSAQRPVS
jgi:hypothetical protein